MLKSAFPVPSVAVEPGMTLRDWFAGQALPAVMEDYFEPAVIAERAYQIADAMQAERDKEAK